jgi:hypothetical protein
MKIIIITSFYGTRPIIITALLFRECTLATHTILIGPLLHIASLVDGTFWIMITTLSLSVDIIIASLE